MDIDINKIDIDRLREDLLNHFYGLAFVVSPVALMDADEVEKATPEKLIEIALNNHFDLDKYKIKTRNL